MQGTGEINKSCVFISQIVLIKDSCEVRLLENEKKYRDGLIFKDAQIKDLTEKLSTAAQQGADEIVRSRKQLEEALKEIEEHKSKRIAAKNEMIAAAKVSKLLLRRFFLLTEILTSCVILCLRYIYTAH